MPDNAAIRVRAFAKINLSLRVIAARPDGYHQLRTTFQSIALHDTLTFVAAPGPFRIECRDPAVPLDRSNLIWRAAERLWDQRVRTGGARRSAHARTAALSGVRVRLVKRVPTQAGLAGGSSDAAATLRALSKLWRLKIDDVTMRAIASDLGADVPYFLIGGTARGEGRGDRLEPLDDEPGAWAVIARPSFGVSTADAFGWWDAMSSRGGMTAGVVGVNDLERPVAARHPEIAQFVEALGQAGATTAAMSGSGSAVFGLFPRESAARRAAVRLGRDPSVTIWVTSTLDRARFRRLSAPKTL